MENDPESKQAQTVSEVSPSMIQLVDEDAVGVNDRNAESKNNNSNCTHISSH